MDSHGSYSPGGHTTSIGRSSLHLVMAGLIFSLTELLFVRGPPRKWLEQYFAKLGPEASKKAATQSVSRIVGALHLLLQLPLAFVVLFDSDMRKDRFYATSPISYLMVTISAGYFLHDLWDCIRRVGDEGYAYLVHASVCFTLFAYANYTGFLHYYGAVFLMWELSTPCVYVRWFLHKLGHGHTRVYVVNGLSMMLAFFLCRNVFGTVMSVDFFRVSGRELTHPRAGGMPPVAIWMYRIGNVAMNALNAFWFYKMLHGAMKLFFGPTSKTVRPTKLPKAED